MVLFHPLRVRLQSCTCYKFLHIKLHFISIKLRYIYCRSIFISKTSHTTLFSLPIIHFLGPLTFIILFTREAGKQVIKMITVKTKERRSVVDLSIPCDVECDATIPHPITCSF